MNLEKFIKSIPQVNFRNRKAYWPCKFLWRLPSSKEKIWGLLRFSRSLALSVSQTPSNFSCDRLRWTRKWTKMQFGESKSLLAVTILMKIAQFKGKILGPSEIFEILRTNRFTHPDRFYIEFGSNPHKDWLRSGCSPMSTWCLSDIYLTYLNKNNRIRG